MITYTQVVTALQVARSYSNRVDTWADSVYIHQLVLRLVQRLPMMNSLWLIPVNAHHVTTMLFELAVDIVWA